MSYQQSNPFTFKTSKGKMKRPSWSDVYYGYPKTTNHQDLPAEKVFENVFGTNYDKKTFGDACGTRVSLALITGGVNVKNDFRITNRKFHLYGGGFIASAIGLKNWLSRDDVFGKADIIIQEKYKGQPFDKSKPDITLKEVQNKIGSKNGIYIMLPKSGYFSTSATTGHATLWVGRNRNAISGKNHAIGAKEIHFWELK